MFYKINFEKSATYYLDKNLYTEEQAIALASDWFKECDTLIFIDEVEEEGE